MTVEQLYSLFRQYPSVQTDTRRLQPGDIFFALKGEHFNGNEFAAAALQAGAAYAVIDDPAFQSSDRCLLVEDGLQALQQLARQHRRQFNIPLLAITGSNGKTTTKELIHAALSSHYRTSTTEGNLNNHIGIPLTLLRIPLDTQIAIIEMGANHQREIAGYCLYTEPTHGLITNCGKAHLEGFGGVEGVRKGKGELFDYLREHQGTAFIMDDYPYLRDMSRGIAHIFPYGTGSGPGLRGRVRQDDPFLEVEITSGMAPAIIPTRLVGGYNLPNILAAVAVAAHFSVPPEKILAALEQYTPSNSRSQLIRRGTNQIILDAYNANPTSMKAAIENLGRMQGDNKVLLLGAMAELGPESLAEHQAILDLLAQYPFQQVVLVGGDFMKLAHPYLSFGDSMAAAEWFRRQGFENASILVKGSRSYRMERVLE